MDALTSPKGQALLEQLGRARERAAGIAKDLHAVDAELEGLSSRRRGYELVEAACAALDELGGLGAADLFWGDGIADGRDRETLRLARSRVEAFEGQLQEVESRRLAIAEGLERAQDDVEILEDDVYRLKQEDEQRKLEWVVERELDSDATRPTLMPWTRGGEDDQRFRRTLAAALLLSLLLGLLLPQIDLPLPERWEPIEVPERLASLIREERPLPPPVTVKEEKKPEEKEPELLKEEPVVAEEPTKGPEKKPTARQTAESKGILAFREKFSGLAETETSARLGSQARISSAGDTARGMPQRSMLTTQAPGSSGGINLASLSRDIGGGGGREIEGVKVVRATSSIGGGTGPERPLSGGPGPGRTDEEIQIVFDRYKAALYRLYNRELRRDPTLQGQMVLRIRIEPDGSVSLCELQASDMNAPDLSSQVVARVSTFDFGAKEGVPTITILYPIDFLPAT